MKIEIKKTYSVWQLISALAGLLAVIASIYHSYNNDYQRATFYAVIYLCILAGKIREDLRCDCEECEDDDTSN
jgi:hypothetical protein